MSGGDRRCACGCPRVLSPGKSKRAIYATEACKHRAYRQRVGEAATAAGFPSRLTVGTLKTATGSSGQSRDRNSGTRERSGGIRVGASTYKRPADVQLLAEVLAAAVDEHPEIRPSLRAARRALDRHRHDQFREDRAR